VYSVGIIAEEIESICKRFTTQVAIEDLFRVYSYEELWDEVNRIKGYMDQIKGKKIGLIMQNETNFILHYLAIITSNNICIPIPYYSKLYEIKNSVSNIGIDFIITSSTELIQINDNLPLIDWLSLEKHCNMLSNTNTEDILNEPKLFLQTSGSTGNPKVVMLSEENIISTALAHANAVGINQDDRFLITMPMHFSSVLTTQILSYLLKGATLIVRNIPMLPRLIMKTIFEERVNCFAAVPSLLRQLVEKAEVTSSPKLRYICVSGAALDLKLGNLILENLRPFRIIQTYGMTEASPRISLGEFIMGDGNPSCGNAVENVRIEIKDEKGFSRGINEVGEIYVKGPNIMMGYYNNYKETKRVLKNGWLQTGDIGFLDKNGDLHVVGRTKNMIISGGQNLYPEEIENCLKEHPDIMDCIVFPLEDPILDEVPAAIIRCDRDIQIDELKSHCYKRLSNYKVPRSFYFLSDFPLTKTGKVDRMETINKIYGGKEREAIL